MAGPGFGGLPLPSMFISHIAANSAWNDRENHCLRRSSETPD